MTIGVHQCRFANSDEILAKRELELKPSRKRRREEAGAPGLDDPFDYPFGDQDTYKEFTSTRRRESRKHLTISPHYVMMVSFMNQRFCRRRQPQPSVTLMLLRVT